MRQAARGVAGVASLNMNFIRILSSPLGRRILRIYFASASLSYLLTVYSEKYLFETYIMPYLRGSKGKAKYASPTIQNQLTALKRQVNKNKAAPCYFRTALAPAAGAGTSGEGLDVTGSIASDAQYRNNITGDRWTIKWIKLSGISDVSNELLRVVVYRPLRTGTTYPLPTTSADCVRILDPASFHVYHDSFVNRSATNADQGYKRFIPINTAVVYNVTATTPLEKGDIKMIFFWKKNTANVPHNTSVQICYTDK